MGNPLVSRLRGGLLGGWCGLGLALVIALQQGHSPERFLLNGVGAGIPLSLLGAVTASLIAHRAGPRERLRLLIRRLGHPLTDAEVQTLLIEPAATQ